MIRRLSAAIAFLALASCGSESAGGRNAFRDVLENVIAQRQFQSSGSAKAPEITRALLDSIDAPRLQVESARRDTRAVMYVSAVRGDILVWRSLDDGTWSLRDGVLIQSRGTGGDILSANASIVFRALQSGQASGQRSYTFLDGDFRQVRRVFDCSIRRVGAETITIVERAYRTDRFDETCSDGTTSFTNTYWRDQGGGKMRKSQQWAGPFFEQVVFTRFI